jgi:hypothetical protein
MYQNTTRGLCMGRCDLVTVHALERKRPIMVSDTQFPAVALPEVQLMVVRCPGVFV